MREWWWCWQKDAEREVGGRGCGRGRGYVWRVLWLLLLCREVSNTSAAARNSAFLLEFMCIRSSMLLPKKDLNWPVAWTNVSRGRTAMGLLRRNEREPEFRRSLIRSLWHSHTYCGQSRRKCLTVLTVIPWQWGQEGDVNKAQTHRHRCTPSSPPPLLLPTFITPFMPFPNPPSSASPPPLI